MILGYRKLEDKETVIQKIRIEGFLGAKTL